MFTCLIPVSRLKRSWRRTWTFRQQSPHSQICVCGHKLCCTAPQLKAPRLGRRCCRWPGGKASRRPWAGEVGFEAIQVLCTQRGAQENLWQMTQMMRFAPWCWLFLAAQKQVMIGNKCSRKMKRKMKRKTQNQSWIFLSSELSGLEVVREKLGAVLGHDKMKVA